MTRPVFSAAMSGGLRVGFHGVRGSTPCEGPQYARYGGHSSCVSARARRPAADRVRSRHRPAPRTATSSAPCEFHGNGAAHAPALGPRAGPAVLRAAAQPGVDARHPRAAPGRRAARRGVRADHVPAVLPDPTRRPQRRRALPRHRRRRLPDRPRQGAVAVRPPRRARRSASASSGTAARSRTSPTTGPGCCPDDPDDYVPHDILELCDGVDLLDPRRAAHARGVRAEAALGSLAPSTTRCTSHASRARSSSCCSTTIPRHGDDELDASPSRTGDRSAALGGPEVDRGLRRPRDRPRGPADDARSSTRSTPTPATMRTVLGHFATGVTIVTAIARRRAGRHGVQLVHVGVARSAARAVLRGEVVDDVAAHPGRGQVGGQHPRRGRRRGVPPLRAEGRRPVRAHDVPARARAARRSSTARSRSSTARPTPSTTPATT